MLKYLERAKRKRTRGAPVREEALSLLALLVKKYLLYWYKSTCRRES